MTSSSMNLDKNSQLFFGCRIDSKLREALAQARPGDRRYFEEGSEFLCICSVGEDERWIGKVIDGGLNVTEVEDIQRNIVSILRRIASDVRISPSAVKIFVVEREQTESPDIVDPPLERGPYIASY